MVNHPDGLPIDHTPETDKEGRFVVGNVECVPVEFAVELEQRARKAELELFQLRKKPKLAGVRPGDTLVLRNGEEHVVHSVRKEPYSLNLMYNVVTENPRIGRYSMLPDVWWVHRPSGELGYSDGTWPGDIIGVKHA